jgi:hypothetical protein
MIFFAAGLIYFGATALAVPQTGKQGGLGVVKPKLQVVPEEGAAKLATLMENEIRISKWDNSGNPLKSESYFFGTYKPTGRCRNATVGGGEGGKKGGKGGKGGNDGLPGTEGTPASGGSGGNAISGAKEWRAAKGGNGGRDGKKGLRTTRVEKGADLECNFWESTECQGTVTKSLKVGQMETFTVDKAPLASGGTSDPGTKRNIDMSYKCVHKSQSSGSPPPAG